MANFKVALSFFLLTLAWMAGAADLPTHVPTQPSLLRENETLAVLNEAKINQPVDLSRRTYNLHLSQLNAERLVMFANQKSVRYEAQNRPALGAQMSYYPVFWRGFWGAMASVAYTNLEYAGTVKTALHWLSADAGLTYRYERSKNSILRPYSALGMGTQVFFQRGTDDYNTSEARGYGYGLLGVAWNITDTLKTESPLKWEMTAQWKRLASPETPRFSLNGDVWSLGMQLAL